MSGAYEKTSYEADLKNQICGTLCKVGHSDLILWELIGNCFYLFSFISLIIILLFEVIYFLFFIIIILCLLSLINFRIFSFRPKLQNG